MDARGIVTIRFQRLTPGSASNTDGFLIPYGCTGERGSSACTESPLLLMTSNIQQAAACTEHISAVLNSLIDEVLRSKNGELRYGFLRCTPPSDEQLPEAPVPEPTDEIVWQNCLDGRYGVIVYGSRAPYTGVLVVRDGDTELFRSGVGLAYDAILGPDAGDVLEWTDTAIAVVDFSKPPAQLIAEALDHIETERQIRIAQLRKSPRAGEAYKVATELYHSREAAVNWLISPNRSLGGRSPIDILDEPQGLDRVQAAVNNEIKTIYPLS